MTFAAGTLDGMFDWKEFKPIIESKPGCSLKVYEGMVHGFGIRGDLNKPEIRKAKEDVVRQVCSFFHSQLQK